MIIQESFGYSFRKLRMKLLEITKVEKLYDCKALLQLHAQQNGMAERFNRTILERVRCMLVSVGLKKVFWTEVVVSASYLINRCPSIALRMNKPEEVWLGHPLNLDRLRVFGCVVYDHIRQDKFEPSNMRCMFLGYPDRVKAYRLWCLEPSYKRFIISCYVVFNEAYMDFKKIDDGVASRKISEEEETKEEVHVEVEHLGNEVCNHCENPYEVVEEAHNAEENEETVDDYLLIRDK